MRMFRRAWPVLAAVLAAGMTAYPEAPMTGEPVVYAHYMPWFRAEKTDSGIVWDHWQWFGKGPKHDPDDILENGRRDIASVYYPLIGPYHGRDPDVLEYHMLTAGAAGISGFIADWYGPNSYSDQVFGDMTRAAERTGMKVAICLEEKTFFPGYADVKTRADVQNVMESQIRHVLDTHAKSPAYLRWDGEPVFFIFNHWGEGPLGNNQLSPGEVSEVLARFKPPVVLVRGGADAAYFDAAQGAYVWCASGKPRAEFYEAAGAAARAGRLRYWVGGVSPGFDDTGVWGWGNGPRKTDRRGTDEYRDNWEDVLRYRPPFVQVITWNDFGEGTIVEPTQEFGFTFLDMTEKYIGRYAGRRANLGDNQWPYRIYLLRGHIRSMPEEPRMKWMGLLDAYVADFLAGRRFLMGWRLERLEAGVEDDLGEIEEAGTQED